MILFAASRAAADAEPQNKFDKGAFRTDDEDKNSELLLIPTDPCGNETVSNL